MSVKPVLNHASLNIVRPELTRLLRQAQSDLQAAAEGGGERLDAGACVALLRQVDGALRMIELNDAAQLARDISAALYEQPGDDRGVLQALIRALDVLARYLEYLSGAAQPVPELLLDDCNAVRATHGAPPLTETYFLPECAVAHALAAPAAPGRGSPGAGDLARRLRHLYQVGLLGVLRGKTDPVHVRMMQRALERMLGITGGEDGEFWWLMCGVLEGFAQGNLLPGAERNRVLTRTERMFRSYLKGAPDDLLVSPPLREELLGLVARSGDGARAREIRDAAGIPASAIADPLRAAERSRLLGESAEARVALGARLQGDFLAVREKLERLSAESSTDPAVLADIATTLMRVAKELDSGGLPQAAADLERAVTDHNARASRVGGRDKNGMLGLADAVVQAEAAIEAFAREARELGRPRTAEGGAALLPAARSALDEARAVLLKTARECLEAVKRDVTAYADTHFDAQLLASAPAPLDAVRGALLILEQPRAAAVTRDTAEVLRRAGSGSAGAGLQENADLLADVLICLEYHLSALANAEEPDPMVLGLAEQSLAQLHLG